MTFNSVRAWLSTSTAPRQDCSASLLQWAAWVVSGCGIGGVLGGFQVIDQSGKPVFSLVGKVCNSP